MNSVTDAKTKAYNDHNVYILGAGFSVEAGLPIVRDFMNRMRDAAAWLEGQAGREREVRAIERVLEFRLKAGAAGYRIPLDLENIEELFSLASASRGEDLAQAMILAIAATLDFARVTATQPAEHQRFILGVLDVAGWEKPEHWSAAPARVQQQVSSGQLKGEWYECPPYDLYIGTIASYFNKGGADRRDTIITLNYDTLIEDTLRGLGIAFSYGIEQYTGWTNRDDLANAQHARGGLQILKLHGSVSWARTTECLAGSEEQIAELPHRVVSDLDHKIVAFSTYDDLRQKGHIPILVAPTWHKAFAGYLAAVRDAAVEALKTATRVIILGYSIPATDQHFRYLLAAGLQDNISLRRVFFVNPGLKEETSRRALEERLSRLFTLQHFDQGVIELVPTSLGEFLGGPRIIGQESSRVHIGRPLNQPGHTFGNAPWTLFPPYGGAGWTIA